MEKEHPQKRRMVAIARSFDEGQEEPESIQAEWVVDEVFSSDSDERLV
jgi:hypothetical protein